MSGGAAEGKRERILAAAWELFARLGYKGTTVEAIARAAAMAKGSVYRYFATKDEVLFALVEGAGEAMARSADALLEGDLGASGDAGGIVRGYISSIVDYRDQYRIYRELVFEARALGTTAAAEAVSRLDRRFEEELARMLRAFAERGVIAPCDYEAASVAILGAYSGLVAHRDAAGKGLATGRVEAVMGRMLCGGILGGLASI